MAPTGPNIVEITDANFEQEVLKSPVPFLLDFSAEWCQPCKAIAPVVEELASHFAGKVRFGTLDINASPQVPTRYQVRSIPTLLLFNGEQVIGQLVGAHPRQKIEELVQRGL